MPISIIGGVQRVMVLYNAAIVRRSAPPEHQPAPQLEALSALDWIGGCYNKGHLLWFCNLSIALKCHIVHRQWITHQRYKWRCCGATDCVNTRKTHWNLIFFCVFLSFRMILMKMCGCNNTIIACCSIFWQLPSRWYVAWIQHIDNFVYDT